MQVNKASPARIGIYAAAKIAKRSPEYLRACDPVLQPLRDHVGRRIYSRLAIERWAAQLEERRQAREAKKQAKALAAAKPKATPRRRAA